MAIKYSKAATLYTKVRQYLRGTEASGPATQGAHVKTPQGVRTFVNLCWNATAPTNNTDLATGNGDFCAVYTNELITSLYVAHNVSSTTTTWQLLTIN